MKKRFPKSGVDDLDPKPYLKHLGSAGIKVVFSVSRCTVLNRGLFSLLNQVHKYMKHIHFYINVK